MTDRIRDTREPGFYIIDNEIIDHYGPTIGVYGVAAYNLLARFSSSKGDNAFPSYDTIAQKLGISRRKAIDTISHLVSVGLVTKVARKTQEGDPTSNLYTLVNIKGGSASPALGVVHHLHQGSASPALGVVHHLHQGSASPAPYKDTITNTPKEKEECASHRTHTTPPALPLTEKAETVTQDLFFERMCWIVGVDWKTTGKEKRGELNQAKGIMEKAGYTADDLVEFWRKVWSKDYRWRDKKSRPTIKQLRDEIGKVKTNDNIMVDCGTDDNTVEYNPQVFEQHYGF